MRFINTHAYASRGGKCDPNNVFAIDKRRNHHREIWHVKSIRNMRRLIVSIFYIFGVYFAVQLVVINELYQIEPEISSLFHPILAKALFWFKSVI